MTLSDFSQVYLIDFEFSSAPGDRPVPICLVAREFSTGQTMRLWEDDLVRLTAAPYPTDDATLCVAYYASAECGCYDALGWPMPSRVLDLFAEFRNLANGLETPCGYGLLGALAWFGLDGIEAAEKDTMRDLALRGGPWTADERTALLDYCEQDVDALKRFSNRPCTTWGGRGTSAHTDAGGPMRAYSMDLRERALLDSDAGMKAADVAAKYRVSGSWVRLLKQRRRETGEVAPRVQRHGRRCMLEPHLHTLAALIAAHPDRTLAELKDALATPASVPTVWRAVRALGLTVKKTVRPSEHDRPDVAAARVAWHAAAPTWDVAHLVCLDETGITTNLLRRYGRAPRGARVHDHAPCGRWQTSTFLAALRVTGLTAPGVFDGAIDGESFRAYIDQILVPTLHPGDIVIADNLGAHKVAGIQRALQAAGATLWYLPPYSPDLNPLELCFAKLKALVRTARCRRTETLWPFLGECLAHFSPDECRNYVRHCGYSAATRS